MCEIDKHQNSPKKTDNYLPDFIYSSNESLLSAFKSNMGPFIFEDRYIIYINQNYKSIPFYKNNSTVMIMRIEQLSRQSKI